MRERLAQLGAWMLANEDEHLEFKEAKNRFDFEELVKYCCALANEGGGHVVLGVTDTKPRRVVGSTAFADLQRTKLGLLQRLHLRADAWELPHQDGRVVVVSVPSRPIGVPVHCNGTYWMRKRFVLARRFYELKGRAGEYTRRKGLDHETRKELLIQHIRESGNKGSPVAELAQVLPDASRNELKTLLRQLRESGRICVRGAKRGARWHLGTEDGTIA